MDYIENDSNTETIGENIKNILETVLKVKELQLFHANSREENDEVNYFEN